MAYGDTFSAVQAAEQAQNAERNNRVANSVRFLSDVMQKNHERTLQMDQLNFQRDAQKASLASQAMDFSLKNKQFELNRSKLEFDKELIKKQQALDTTNVENVGKALATNIPQHIKARTDAELRVKSVDDAEHQYAAKYEGLFAGGFIKPAKDGSIIPGQPDRPSSVRAATDANIERQRLVNERASAEDGLGRVHQSFTTQQQFLSKEGWMPTADGVMNMHTGQLFTYVQQPTQSATTPTQTVTAAQPSQPWHMTPDAANADATAQAQKDIYGAPQAPTTDAANRPGESFVVVPPKPTQTTPVQTAPELAGLSAPVEIQDTAAKYTPRARVDDAEAARRRRDYLGNKIKDAQASAMAAKTDLEATKDSRTSRSRQLKYNQEYQNLTKLIAERDGSNSSSTATPQTKQDYDRLPSGSMYIEPTTGETKRKR